MEYSQTPPKISKSPENTPPNTPPPPPLKTSKMVTPSPGGAYLGLEAEQLLFIILFFAHD